MFWARKCYELYMNKLGDFNFNLTKFSRTCRFYGDWRLSARRSSRADPCLEEGMLLEMLVVAGAPRSHVLTPVLVGASGKMIRLAFSEVRVYE